jgi:hypothetical protein
MLAEQSMHRIGSPLPDSDDAGLTQLLRRDWGNVCSPPSKALQRTAPGSSNHNDEARAIM